MIKRILTCVLSLFLLSILYAQPDSDAFSDMYLPYEKVYLHTDRDVYYPGDSIWFKAYVVNGYDNKLLPDYKNVYVELIAESGEVIDSCLLLSLNGVASNVLKVPDNLEDGSCTIRAYTKYLLNFDEESLFHRKIAVAGNNVPAEFAGKDIANQEIDVDFLPEGGNLVLNAANNVAFKATDEKGRGIAVSGKIVDDTGQEVVRFESVYKGMGRFIMMPEEGKSYKAVVDQVPQFESRLPQAGESGIAIQYKAGDPDIQVVLNRNFKQQDPLDLVVMVTGKGEVVFEEEITLTGFQHSMNIYKGFFPEGISKITVSDFSDNILAERLVYNHDTREETLEVNLTRDEAGPRQKVKVDLQSLVNLGNDTIRNSFSCSVVSEEYLDQGRPGQSAESYLLLSSELKGSLETPADCFTDEEAISANDKLDLVMLVNGWRRYLWDDLEKYKSRDLPYLIDAGLTVTGRVEKVLGSKPVEDAIVQFGPFSPMLVTLKDTTDENGNFSFDRLFLNDSSQVMIMEMDQQKVELVNTTPPVFDPGFNWDEINKSAFSIDIPARFYRTEWFQNLREQEFEPAYETKLIEEVEVKGDENLEQKFWIAVWGEPNRAFDLNEDGWSYSNLAEFIEYKFPGLVTEVDGGLSYRNSYVPIYLDGFPLIGEQYEVLYNRPFGDFSKIFFHKGAFLVAFMGSESNGAMAIVSIFTKTGYQALTSAYERPDFSKITPVFAGYRQPVEFYAPQYPLEGNEETENRKPDFRPTLYWNPNLTFKDNNAELEFYTSDMLGRYRIILEGIDKNGTVIHKNVPFGVVTSGQ